jgi:hypothetical protein
MIKFGRFSTTPPGAVSYMPAFEDVLSDPEILEVMAFIKARWPLGLRVSQGCSIRALPGCRLGRMKSNGRCRPTAPRRCSAGGPSPDKLRPGRGTTLADAILLDASVEWWLTGIKTPTAAPAA